MLYSPNASSAVLNASIALLLFALASAAVAGLYSPGLSGNNIIVGGGMILNALPLG